MSFGRRLQLLTVLAALQNMPKQGKTPLTLKNEPYGGDFLLKSSQIFSTPREEKGGASPGGGEAEVAN